MTQKEIVKLFKRFLIVFLLVGVPIVCVLTLTAGLKSIFVILIAVFVVAIVFCLEEFLRYKKIKKRQEKRKKEGKE
ncbi:MAG: hypothetical protein ACI4TI_01935 [Christensenellales bacterium]